MIDHLLTDTITRLDYTKNRYGDYEYGEPRDVACRFREINNLNKGDHHEELDADALVHLPASEEVVEGDPFIYDGQYYKADQILPARKFGPEVQFVKVGLQRMRQVS